MKLSNMSLALMAAAGLLSLTASLRAEDPAPATPPPIHRNGPMTVDAELKVLTEKLTLTDDQQPKVKAVLEDRQKEQKEIRQLPQEERAEKRKALREETLKKMKGILTADQFTQYQELLKKMGPGGRRAGNPPPPQAPPAAGASK